MVAVYLLFLVGLLVGGMCGVRYYTDWFERFQQSRPRYAPERAVAALAKSDLPTAKAEVAQLLQERPFYTQGFFNLQYSELYEGPVLRNRVMSTTELATRLMQARLWNEAEAVLWKALLEHHIAGRAAEWLPVWECLYYTRLMRAREEANAPKPVPALSGVLPIAEIIAAHGLERARLPYQMEPYPFTGDARAYEGLPSALVSPDLKTGQPGSGAPLMRALKQAYEPDNETNSRIVGNMMAQMAGPELAPQLARGIQLKAHACLVAGGERGQARDLLRRISGADPARMDSFWNSGGTAGPPLIERDPALMQLYWQDRPSTASLSPGAFLKSFQGDARVTLADLGRAECFATGYFHPRQHFDVIPGGGILMYASGACRLKFTTRAPVRQMVFAYQAFNALGVAPILLAKVDNEPFVPLYADASTSLSVERRVGSRGERPGVFGFECNLPPGQHQLELWYLNDSGFEWPRRRIKEDRNLFLDALALVHVTQ
jgi:hypothetical protein